ncbi:unnamed protein product [Protopolystoma xenopodis]|uniref:Uncharacterized protein n=1 Tax=Protopolystoma xenopodis TaxID=117903 RepID=A0A448WWU3_9PLAT|nr:unnamed protein product [Protopolystoma xenopodis]
MQSGRVSGEVGKVSTGARASHADRGERNAIAFSFGPLLQAKADHTPRSGMPGFTWAHSWPPHAQPA